MQVFIQNPAKLYRYDKNRLAEKEPDEQNAEEKEFIFSEQKTKFSERKTYGGRWHLSEGVRYGRMVFLMGELAKKAAAMAAAAAFYFAFPKEPTRRVAQPNMGSA